MSVSNPHAHGDRSRSLSIKLKPDGETVLLNCFIGDSKASIVAAAGLTLAHLFLDPQRNGTKPREVCALFLRRTKPGVRLISKRSGWSQKTFSIAAW